MPTPKDAPYKVISSELKERLRKATAAGQGGGQSSRKQLRDSQRANGSLDAGAYGRGLTNARTRAQKAALRKEV